jgi:hypothetical protein
VHHCEGLMGMIKTDILLAIFGVQNKKISICNHAYTRRFQRTQEDTRPKRTPIGWQVEPTSLTPLPTSPWLCRLAPSFWNVPPMPPRVPSTSNWSRFIQWWSWEVTRIDDVAVTWPLLHLGLYKDAPSPSRRPSLNQIKAQHQRIRARLSNVVD